MKKRFFPEIRVVRSIILMIVIMNCCHINNTSDEISEKRAVDRIIQQNSKKITIVPTEKKINQEDLTVITPGQNGVPLPDIIKAGTPKVYTFEKIQSVKAENPKIINLPEKPAIITPGMNSVPFPKKFSIPDSGWNIQHGDTVYAPQTKIFSFPKPIQALPPVIKDGASCNIQCLSIRQGFTSYSIHSMIADKSGNIWFGSWGNGVYRFDGTFYFHYNETEGLSNQIVVSMLEDHEGNLWFGTFEGVCKYNGNSFTRFSEEQGLSSNRVQSILEDTKGNLWFGTDEGVSKYDGKSFINFTEREGLPNNIILSILEDKDGILWFGTHGGLSRYDGISFINYKMQSDLDIIESMALDKEGNIWIGTCGSGLTYFNKEFFVHYTDNEGLSDNMIQSIYEDRDGNIWFGTDNGVNKYDGKYFYYYNEKTGLIDNRILTILEDEKGNIWFGTESGVSKLINNSFNYYNLPEELGQNRIQTMLEDRNGNLWFGTWLNSRYGGVYKYDGKSLINYTENEGLASNWVLSMYEDKFGNLWFGTWHGVSKFDGIYFTNYTQNEGLVHDWVYSVIVDKNDYLWCGTEAGVSKFDGKSFIQYSENEGLCNNIVYSIIEDKAGNLWFGTDAGISKFNGTSFINYTAEENFFCNYTWSILEDRNAHLWLSSRSNGVYEYNGDHFINYTVKDGLISNSTRSLLEDKNGDLWFGTDKGITYLKYSSGTDTSSKDLMESNNYTVPQMYNFDEQDGLIELFCNFNAAILDSKNQLWWGTGKTLTMLDLDEFELSTDTPQIRLIYVEINQKYVDYRKIPDPDYQSEHPDAKDLSGTFNEVNNFYNVPLNLDLPFNANHITFYFSAIDWAAQHQVEYQYMLAGLDRTWSSLSKENKADYRNIPSGKYTFKVKAIGVAKKWSNTYEYNFIIRPPWWRTLLAYLIYCTTLILLVFVFIRLRTRGLIRETDKLEKQVSDRTHEIQEANEELLQQKEELQSTLENLQKTQEQLIESEKMSALGGLVAGVAHEINTPVGITITAASGLLEETNKMAGLFKEDKISRAEFKEYLNSTNHAVKLIMSNMERTATMVQSFKQISVDQVSETRRVFNLKDYTQDIVRSLYPKFKNRKITIDLNIDGKLDIDNYPGAYSQILTNLILNSLAHGFEEEQEGKIELTVVNKDDGLIIEYKDNGNGIAKENLKKIFDPFFTTNRKSGTGLGLHIVYNLVNQKMGGTITCESEQGKGVLFMMKLPLISNKP